MHHVLHLAETDGLIQDPARLRGFQIDLGDVPFQGLAHQPADDPFPGSLLPVLRAHIDIHEIGAPARRIVRGRHLVVKAKAAWSEKQFRDSNFNCTFVKTLYKNCKEALRFLQSS